MTQNDDLFKEYKMVSVFIYSDINTPDGARLSTSVIKTRAFRQVHGNEITLKLKSRIIRDRCKILDSA